jgi:PEP-CTERM motif-containing protein
MLKPKQSKATQGSVLASLKWLLPLLVGAFLALSPTQARADEITVAGSTSGSLSGSGDFAAGGLTFAGSTFGNTTTLNGSALIPLGSISLGSFPSTYSGNFVLDVTFTLPFTIASGATNSFTYSLSGNVTNSGGNAVLFDFTNFMQNLTFTNAGYTGSFTIAVPAAVLVSSGSTAPLTGTILNGVQTPVSAPEPSTLLLSGIGLGGVLLMRRVWGARFDLHRTAQ